MPEAVAASAGSVAAMSRVGRGRATRKLEVSLEEGILQKPKIRGRKKKVSLSNKTKRVVMRTGQPATQGR